jgi:hypothetical protein
MKLDVEEELAIQRGEAVRAMEDGIEVVAVRADVFDLARRVVYDEPLSAE